MTLFEPIRPISTSAVRQLLGAASDAGLGDIVAARSIQNDGNRLVITIDARDVRALTNWFLSMADSHRDAPITANTGRGVVEASGGDASWMRRVTNDHRTTPVGYEMVNIPSRHEGTKP